MDYHQITQMPLHTSVLSTYVGRWTNSNKVISIDAPDMYIAASNLEYINGKSPASISSIASDVIVAGYYDIYDEVTLKVHIVYNSASPSTDSVTPGIIYGTGVYQPKDEAIISVRKLKGFKYIGIFKTLDGALTNDTSNSAALVTTDTEYYYTIDPNLADEYNIIHLYASFIDSGDVDEDTLYKFEGPYFIVGNRDSPIYTYVELNTSSIIEDDPDSVPTTSNLYNAYQLNKKYTDTKLDRMRVTGSTGNAYEVPIITNSEYDNTMGINRCYNILEFEYENKDIIFNISEFNIDKTTEG